MADLPLLENSNFRFILIDTYSDISGTPVSRKSGRSTPPRKEQFQIHTDRCVLQELRQKSTGRSTPPENSNFRFILIDAYSDSSGTPGGRSSARSTPQKTAISDLY